MRKLPTILAAAFIVITLWRVGQFAASRMVGGWPGWVFSVALGVGVYVAAYYTRDSITVKDGKEDARSRNVKQWAWVMLAVCAVSDGLFNLAEVWQAVKPPASDWLLNVATGVYGLFPTLAAAGFGALQGHVDRLPKPPANEKTSVLLALRRRAVQFLLPPVEPTAIEQIATAVNAPAPVDPVALPLPPVEPTEIEQASLFACDCGYRTNDPKAWAGHRSAEARAKRNGKPVEVLLVTAATNGHAAPVNGNGHK